MATETLRPNATGDETNIEYEFPVSTAHWDLLNDVTPDQNRYVAAFGTPNTWQRDLYNLPASSGSGTINFIKVYARSYTSDASPIGELKIVVKATATIDESSAITLTGSYVVYSNQWNTNPADSQAWEWADIDALQIGIALRYATVISQCNQIYVEVDYTIPDPQLVTPTTLAHTITSYIPTIAVSDHITVTPTTLALILDRHTPTIVITDIDFPIYNTRYKASWKKTKECEIRAGWRQKFPHY